MLKANQFIIPGVQKEKFWNDNIQNINSSISLILWHPGAFQDFRKNTETHVALCRNFSRSVSATDLVKASNNVASLLVCTRKNFFGCGFFVSDIISGRVLGHLGPLCLALGANR